jgi:hypothetical protein
MIEQTLLRSVDSRALARKQQGPPGGAASGD